MWVNVAGFDVSQTGSFIFQFDIDVSCIITTIEDNKIETLNGDWDWINNEKSILITVENDTEEFDVIIQLSQALLRRLHKVFVI
jgi:hypothetical protein